MFYKGSHLQYTATFTVNGHSCTQAVSLEYKEVQDCSLSPVSSHSLVLR